MRNLLCVALVAGLALPASNSFAQPSPNFVSDVLNVYNPAGFDVYSVYESEAQEDANLSAIVMITDPCLRLDLTQYGNPITFLESPPLGNDVYSDIVGIFKTTGGAYYLGFSSDTEDYGTAQGETGGPGQIIIREPANLFRNLTQYDVTRYLAPDLRNAGWVATFKS